MEDLLAFIALVMLVIGPIQVVWALIWIITTKHDPIRYRLGKYLLGVIAYFAAFVPLVLLAQSNGIVILLELHFFGSAFALCWYHAKIVAMSQALDDHMQHAGDSERTIT